MCVCVSGVCVCICVCVYAKLCTHTELHIGAHDYPMSASN